MLNIRSMTVRDVDKIFAMETRSHVSPWSHQIFRDCVIVGYDCLVLELLEHSGKSMVGFLISRRQNNHVHILNFCIDKPFQGRGYGKHFLNEYITHLQKQSIDYVELEARPTNQTAISLYTKFGFVQRGIKTAYYKEDDGSVEDALIFEKQLDKP